MLRIDQNLDPLIAALTRASDRLGDLTDVMDDIGNEMLESTLDNFRKQESPDGNPWAAKSQATLDHYARTRSTYDLRPLHLDGSLSSDISVARGPDFVEWGSSAIQAAVMQFGATKGEFGNAANGSPIPWGDIPARPFLGIGPEDETAILATIEEWLSGLLEK